jgi:Big-like domain-containing protein
MKLSKRGAVLVLALVAGLLPPAVSSADTIAVDFEGYTVGSVDGQDGWSSIGSLPGGGCNPPDVKYDHEVADVPLPIVPEFESKALRISNSVVSDCLPDQTFSKSTVNEAGETTATNGGWSGGARLGHFETQWNFVSALPSWEPGLQMAFSPDRGDGARMSLLRIDDTIPGLMLTFTDYQSGFAASGCSDLNFVAEPLGSPSIMILDRFPITHTIRMTMDLLAGPSNDVVKVFVNGDLVHTGTSWEDFYRECFGGTSRTVDSLLFHTVGTPGVDDCLECEGGGFFIDNLIVKTGGVRVVATGGSTTVTEGGPNDTYTLVLEEQPAADVTVTASWSGDITVSPSTFVFTSANWNVPQTVTVTAIDDTVAEPPHTVQIEHSATSADPNWNGIAIVNMPVLVLDNDGLFIITESGGVTTVVEGGATDTYTMRLSMAPTANVTVSVTPDAQVTTSTASLTFTPANWNIPQTVTVTAVDDLIVEPSPHPGIISHGPAVSADATFNGKPVPSVTALITDNDPADIIAPAAPVIGNCPGGPITTTTFLLTGTAEPGSSVTVFVDGSPRGTVPANASGNWQILLQFTTNGPHTITATARDGAGNVSAVSFACVITVAADFTPPAPPVITSPTNGATTAACVTVTITFDTDTDRLLIFDNGTQIANVDVNPPASPYSNTFCFTTGIHRLTAIAVDAAGNRSVPSNAVTITVDAEPPTVHITKPSGYILMQISIFNDPLITGIANDIHSGVDRIELTYEPVFPPLGADRATTATCPTCPSAPNITTDWFDTPNPALEIGLYTVTATAFDRVGNSATTDDLLLFIF